MRGVVCGGVGVVLAGGGGEGRGGWGGMAYLEE